MPVVTIGLDFGTLSARALVADVATGAELASAAMDYPHGVMDERLPDGTRLRPDWALQHPGDYLECLRRIVPEALAKAGVSPADVIGLGLDCTASTSLPVDAENRPLCLMPEYAPIPHAWAMLWKHHAAEPWAARMTEIARARGEAFLPRYGGRVSSEWLLPKLWQILDEAPEIYAAADRFIDAGDWLVQLLTGGDGRSACIAGYKAFWNGEYPSRDFLRALDPRFERVCEDKLRGTLLPIGSRAGALDARGAELTGLPAGVPVSVASIDAHVAVPAAGVTEPGTLLMILGTSGCHLLVDRADRAIPGLCGVVKDGMMPGMMGYEAGQSCLGDHFAWAVNRLCPAEYRREAEARGMDLHAWLTALAARQKPGESGLLALDWWNGNRSVLVDFDLSGMLLGLTLSTKPEDIYRALIEATAYGAREIVEAFEGGGIPVRTLVACGGIARKNPLMMQIWADVLNREIRVSASTQASALGAAIMGAVAAGSAAGGYDTVADAARAMGSPVERRYVPVPEDAAVYDRLFREYHRLHDYFGRGENDVMKRLRQLREEQR